MTVLRAPFDGKIFVPDVPLDLPPGRVTLQVIEVDNDLHPLTLAAGGTRRIGSPPVHLLDVILRCTDLLDFAGVANHTRDGGRAC